MTQSSEVNVMFITTISKNTLVFDITLSLLLLLLTSLYFVPLQALLDRENFIIWILDPFFRILGILVSVPISIITYLSNLASTPWPSLYSLPSLLLSSIPFTTIYSFLSWLGLTMNIIFPLILFYAFPLQSELTALALVACTFRMWQMQFCEPCPVGIEDCGKCAEGWDMGFLLLLGFDVWFAVQRGWY
jgi:hypothetical protein